MVETHHGTKIDPPGGPWRGEQGSSGAHLEHPESMVHMDREAPNLHDMFNDLQDRVIREQRQQREFLERIYARMEQANPANTPPNVSSSVRDGPQDGHQSERGEAASQQQPSDPGVNGTECYGGNQGNNDQPDHDRYNNHYSRNVGEGCQRPRERSMPSVRSRLGPR